MKGLADAEVLTTADMVPDTPVTVMADARGRISHQATAKRQRLIKGVRWQAQASLRQRLCLVADSGKAKLVTGMM